VRSYEQFCALAKALDVVGDRWTLLIIRELLIRGRCRYTDLREGLPGVATNLLAIRLRELEQAELITREDAPPPVAAALYQLTERGKALEPVILQLGQWGAPLLTKKSKRDHFRSHWLSIPFGMHLTDNTPKRPPVSIEVRADDQPLTITTVGDGSISARPGSTPSPNAVIEGQPSVILDLLANKITLHAARRAGLKYEGDPKVLSRVQRKR
jgi:DNA-binding HxlR family transcriptional regulator